MQFHTIQNGNFIVNLEAIASIKLLPGGAIVTLTSSDQFTFRGEDFDDLMEWVNTYHE